MTRAEVTRDLRYAKIYISVLEEDKREPMMKALKSAAGFIRRELGKRMLIRYSPEMSFVSDGNIAYGVHIAASPGARRRKRRSGQAMETKTINDREGLLEDIRQARKIVLCAHVSPDGDTLGSSLAMRLALEKMGKQVWVICQDAVPGYLSFLPGAEKVQRPEALGPVHPEPGACAWMCPISAAWAAASDVFEAAQHTAQVDHHGTNPYYAQRNRGLPFIQRHGPGGMGADQAAGGYH